jgi:WD40 repeat protein
MRVLRGHRRAVRAAAFAPGDPATLATSGDDGTVRLWNPGTGQNWATLTGHRGGVLCLAFSPDGGQLVTGGRDGSLCLWDVAMQRPLDELPLFGGPVAALAFAPDGGGVLAAPRDLSALGGPFDLVVWRFAGGSAFEVLPWRAPVVALAADAVGGVLAVADETREVALCGEDLRRCEAPRFAQRVRGLAVAPGGRVLAVAAGKVAEVCDATTGARRSTCKGHRAEVRAVAFGPGGRTLLTGSADRTVRLWDTASGRGLAAWEWALGPVRTVAYAPDGMTAAAGGDKPDVVVWDVEP